jgi:hypothetical protein
MQYEIAVLDRSHVLSKEAMVVDRNPIRVLVSPRERILGNELEAFTTLFTGSIGQHMIVEKLEYLVGRATLPRHDECVVPVQLSGAVETDCQFAGFA